MFLVEVPVHLLWFARLGIGDEYGLFFLGNRTRTHLSLEVRPTPAVEEVTGAQMGCQASGLSPLSPIDAVGMCDDLPILVQGLECFDDLFLRQRVDLEEIESMTGVVQSVVPDYDHGTTCSCFLTVSNAL